MTDAYLQIGLGKVALSALLLLGHVALSFSLRLGLGKQLLVAATRMVIQLFLVAFILEWIFAQRHPLIILAMALWMAGIAGITSVQRQSHRFPGIYWENLVSVLGSSFIVTGISLFAIIRPDPFYDPQYIIPMLGMVLGNSLNGISIGLDRFLSDLQSRRDWIETVLALGATRWEAAHEIIRNSIRTGLIPTINSMVVMGIVSLPGMMTGQILAGAKPADAVRYQIVIVFMIVASAALGTFSSVMLAYASLFSPRHRLRSEKIQALARTKKKSGQGK
jgi:putative ABC transport system permease protein